LKNISYRLLKILLLCAFLSVPVVSHAAVPQTLSYQGQLTSATGTPVNGAVTITFNLYSLLSGGTALWSETQSVMVSNGLFNVILGNTTPLTLPFDTPYYLGLQVSTDAEMQPRQALTSVGSAIQAGMASSLNCSGCITAAHLAVGVAISGPQGQTGPPGANGTNGTDGATGATGPAGPGVTWVNVTTSTQQAVSNTGYLANNGAAGVTIVLPASPTMGDIIQVNGVGSGGWLVVQNGGQFISQDMAGTGATKGGTIGGGQDDSVELQYVGSNTFTVLNFVGHVTVSTGGYVEEGGQTWMPVSGTQYTYASAVSLCAGSISGLTGWRLPTQPELSALYTSGAMNGQGWTLYTTWSSTPGTPGSQYGVGLDNGNVVKTIVGILVVTCVR